VCLGEACRIALCVNWAFSAQKQGMCLYSGEGGFVYNKFIMNAKIPQPAHESYLKHRKDRVWKIIFPVVLSVVLCAALIVLIWFATFRNNGDVARWAAVSTIWIVIPIMIGMVIMIALLGGLVYLMYRLLNATPNYTGLAQDYVNKAAIYIKRGADAVAKPVINFNGILASISAFFERMKP